MGHKVEPRQGSGPGVNGRRESRAWRPSWRRLNAREIDAYDLIPGDLARRVHVVSIPFLPGSYVAITLGRFVCIARDIPDDGTSELLAHELVHVGQWQEVGKARFVLDYVGHFARGLREYRSWNKAYRGIAAEVEARTKATSWCQRCL